MSGKPACISLLILVIVFSPLSVLAKITTYKSHGPLHTRTQNPLYLQLIAMPMESTQTVLKNHFEATLSTTYSNVFEFDQVSNTMLNLDMEIWRTALTSAYGLTDNFDVKVEIPFISNGGGFFDPVVQWHHNLFNLPNGGRELVSDNLFNYNVTQGGTNLINHSSTPLGLSDISLRFKYALDDKISLPFSLSVAPYLKLPTGRSAKGLGSGAFDGGVSLFAEKQIKRFTTTTQVGTTFLGNGEGTSIQRNFFFSFGESLSFQLWQNFSPIVQIIGNTSAHNNVDTSDLKQIVLDLNIGFAGDIPVKQGWIEEFFYQASFSEDIMGTGPSVDFSVLLLVGMRHSFRTGP